jgi:hypothetical protein
MSFGSNESTDGLAEGLGSMTGSFVKSEPGGSMALGLADIAGGLGRQLEVDFFVEGLELGGFVRRLGRQLDFDSVVGLSVIGFGLKLDLIRGEGKRECLVDIYLNGTVCFRGLCDTAFLSRKMVHESSRYLIRESGRPLRAYTLSCRDKWSTNPPDTSSEKEVGR